MPMTSGKLALLGHYVDTSRWIACSASVWVMVFVPAMAWGRGGVCHCFPLTWLMSIAPYVLMWQSIIFFFNFQSCLSSLNPKTVFNSALLQAGKLCLFCVLLSHVMPFYPPFPTMHFTLRPFIIHWGEPVCTDHSGPPLSCPSQPSCSSPTAWKYHPPSSHQIFCILLLPQHRAGSTCLFLLLGIL